jgi:glycosyltransferase involved in cell wall biosynthesis
MKIGIDISQTAYRGTGVARYTHSLVSALTSYDKKNEYVFFYSSLRLPLDPKLKQLIQKAHQLKEFKIPQSALTLLWNKLHLMPIENLIGDIDVFISSDWTEPPAKKAIKITTLHDMIVYVYPETATPSIIAQQKDRHRFIKKESSGVFVDSIATGVDAEKYLGIPKDKIHLLYPAVETKKPLDWEIVQKKHKITKPYILTVGKLEPRKNLKRLLEAFQKTGITDLQLIVVGDKGWGDISEISSPHISFLGFVPDDELAALYSHAEFFVFPSLYEGFGYPIIEAMGYKCPVACADSSSLTEIGKDAVEFFNPQDTDDIALSIKLLHENNELRTQLIKEGFQRYKSFSLDNFAKNFVKIVQTIYDNRR